MKTHYYTSAPSILGDMQAQPTSCISQELDARRETFRRRVADAFERGHPHPMRGLGTAVGATSQLLRHSGGWMRGDPSESAVAAAPEGLPDGTLNSCPVPEHGRRIMTRSRHPHLRVGEPLLEEAGTVLQHGETPRTGLHHALCSRAIRLALSDTGRPAQAGEAALLAASLSFLYPADRQHEKLLLSARCARMVGDHALAGLALSAIRSVPSPSTPRFDAELLEQEAYMWWEHLDEPATALALLQDAIDAFGADPDARTALRSASARQRQWQRTSGIVLT